MYGLGGEYWALSNVLLSLVAVIVSIGLLISLWTKRTGEAPYLYKKRRTWRISAVVLLLISVGIFFLTEDFGAEILLVDEWSVVTVVLFGAQVVAWSLSKVNIGKKKSNLKTNTC